MIGYSTPKPWTRSDLSKVNTGPLYNKINKVINIILKDWVE